MRLIDADALVAVPNVCKVTEYDETGYGMSYNAVPVKAIYDAPTIEAEPVRHGQWVHDDLGHTYCSECHERIPYIHCYSDEPNSDLDEEWDEEMPESAYCSHCGAKMDGGAGNAK